MLKINEVLKFVCDDVAAMKPGQRQTFHREVMGEIPTFYYNGVRFTAADRVLENIVGSSYTHSYEVNPASGDVTFHRHENTGAIHYQSPDRRSE